MTIGEPNPTLPAPEPDRESQRDDTPPFPTKFGHDRRRQPPASRGEDGAPHALDDDPFEDDGGL